MSLLIAVALFCAGQSSLAQLIGEAPIPPHPNNAIPDYDFEWVVINRPGNIPYDGRFVDPVFDPIKVEGHGSVPYTYRISMLEFTTAQYVEFFNTFAPIYPELGNLLSIGVDGGFIADPFYSGPGQRIVLAPHIENAGMVPAGGITWRNAARYCNWLHNNKSADPASLESGVYDTSTFTQNANNTVNDQDAHDPGARFWIPTLDEWIKVVHFDPNRFGENQPGWWQYPYVSDEPPIPGLPGDGNTSEGLSSLIGTKLPLRSYPNTRTPWGLWDASGAASEYTEEWSDLFGPGIHFARIIDGSGFSTSLEEDSVEATRIISPSLPSGGLRVAGAVQPRADMNGDLFINVADLAYLLERWGTNEAGPDINGDGFVGGADLGLMLGAWPIQSSPSQGGV